MLEKAMYRKKINQYHVRNQRKKTTTKMIDSSEFRATYFIVPQQKQPLVCSVSCGRDISKNRSIRHSRVC